MSAVAPLRFEWTGEAMIPLNPRAADRQYVVGERYNLEHSEDRSSASHAQYFAAVGEAWQNLPEALDGRFASPDHLRKYALIMTGFRDERSFVAVSNAEALRLAAFLRPIDEYAVVSVNGAVVLMLTAKSQSYRAMGKAEFQHSKDCVLDYVASLVGTDAAALRDNAA